MANKRIKDLSTTAAVTASDDFIAVDGATNGTRKLDAYSPTFGGNLTVSGGTIGTAASTNLTLNGGSSGASLVLGQGASGNVDTYSNGYHTWRRGGVTKMFLTASDNLLLGTTTDTGEKLQVNGTAAISGALSIGNTVQTAVSVASTHKVTISIGGTTYYLLATNV